jgi:alkaline phosphatase
MTNNQPALAKFGRRAFLQNGTLLLAATATADASLLWATPSDIQLKVGLMTDLHYADKEPRGTRHYRQTLDKLSEASEALGPQGCGVLVELGDLIDAADSVETEQRYLATINRPFSAIAQDRHYVLGNHCVDTLTKEEFLGAVEQPKSYYSFDRAGIHFVVLDACFRGDGQPYGRKNSHWNDANIPAAELDWLKGDLKASARPTIVLAHQRLDVSNQHGVKNGAEVRSILEAAGNVLAVFQGHSHQNDLHEIGGIAYCTLVAMVEGSGAEQNAYALLEIDSSNNLRLHGFRKQQSRQWRVRNG